MKMRDKDLIVTLCTLLTTDDDVSTTHAID